MSNNEIKKENKQKNRYQPLLTFQVTWLLDRKHHTWNNSEAQSPTNQILNDKIEKKINYTKGSKIKN